MRLSPFLVTIGLVLAGSVSALANDSTASFAAGGLVLGKTNDIAMRSENLSVSAKEIRVVYVFRNTSDQAITTTVAFPVPEIPASPYSDIAIPTDDLSSTTFEVRHENFTPKRDLAVLFLRPVEPPRP